MRPASIVTLILGLLLLGFGIWGLVKGIGVGAAVPVVLGGALCYLAWGEGRRVALLVFGHACIVLGCFLITWGIYLLPHSKPTLGYILGGPLFWGFFSLMGGVCANFHGFCKCIRGLE